MKLRIKSDGTAAGTRVIVADTGEEIGKQVTAVSWSLDANKDRTARITIELYGGSVELDVEGEVLT